MQGILSFHPNPEVRFTYPFTASLDCSGYTGLVIHNHLNFRPFEAKGILLVTTGQANQKALSILQYS